MTLTRIALMLAFSGMVASAASATSLNLLTNGSFETGDLSGWTKSGYATDGQNAEVIAYSSTSGYPGGNWGGSAVTPDNGTSNPGYDPVGNYALYLLTDKGSESFTQEVSLVAGTMYTFGFDYLTPSSGYSNPDNATFTVQLGDGAPIELSAAATSPDTWYFTEATATFTASTTGTFDLTFSTASNTAPAKDFIIDRVFLTDSSNISAVPESASWAMMVGGFGIVGGALRRKRSVAVVNFG